jgi:hypothetical protein
VEVHLVPGHTVVHQGDRKSCLLDQVEEAHLCLRPGEKRAVLAEDLPQ